MFSNRLATVTRCPGYLEGGVPALANPCLYICENSSPLGLQYACRQLGLPLSCICLVPANTDFGECSNSIESFWFFFLFESMTSLLVYVNCSCFRNNQHRCFTKNDQCRCGGKSNAVACCGRYWLDNRWQSGQYCTIAGGVPHQQHLVAFAWSQFGRIGHHTGTESDG